MGEKREIWFQTTPVIGPIRRWKPVHWKAYAVSGGAFFAALILFAAVDAGNNHSWQWPAGLAVIGLIYWLLIRRHVEDIP
jgi:RsiW-degrading membrane proteinase PrsW (M82 family)